MVRLAQNFSMSLPLLDGQGNFGSMDGDPPAMRYTEIRLGKVADTLLEDIDKNTVKFVDNYDTTLIEPEVLPARYPNLLVNGSGGIAVGMATNIPPHNLGDSECLYFTLEDPKAMIKKKMRGPDFPTGYNNCGTGIKNFSDQRLCNNKRSYYRKYSRIEEACRKRDTISVNKSKHGTNCR